MITRVFIYQYVRNDGLATAAASGEENPPRELRQTGIEIRLGLARRGILLRKWREPIMKPSTLWEWLDRLRRFRGMMA